MTLINYNIISTPFFLTNIKPYAKIHAMIFSNKKEKQLLKIMDENYYNFCFYLIYPQIFIKLDI